MYSFVLLMSFVARRARGTGGVEIVVANVDIWCGCVASVIRNLVQTLDSLSGGGNPNVVGERNSSFCLRKCWRAIMGLAGDVCGVARVNDSGFSGDDDGVIGESGGEGEEGGRSLVRVHIGVTLLPSVLLCLASSGALSTVCLLLLVLG